MLAETAELAVVLKLKDQLTGGLTAAESKLGMLETTAGRTATGSLTRLQTVTNGVGTALGHAKSQLSGLIGGFGLLAGGAGLFSVFGGLEQGVQKVEAMGLAVEKLTGVTGLSVHTASQLVAVMEKYGIDTGKATTIAAFAEKTLGKLDATTAKAATSTALLALENQKLTITAEGGKTTAINKAIAEQKAKDAMDAGAAATTKLTALDAQYGLHLVDVKGKVVDFASEVNQVADLWINKAIPANEKATVAAQLLGRGYIAMVPMLALGSKGIAEAAAEADKLGVTLKSATDVTTITKFIAEQRDAQEHLGGLEERLGLLVMPDLTAGLTAFSTFLDAHSADIESGFKDLLSFAEEIGGAFTNVVIPAIQEIGGVWNSLPGPIKELLIGGFLANKAVKWTFGIDVASLAGGALKGAIQGLFKNATTASMSVEAGVVNVAGGVPGVGGAAGGAASAVEGAGGAAVAETGWAAGGLAGLAALTASVLGSAAVAAGIISVENKITGTTAADIAHANTHGQFGARTAAQGAAIAAANAGPSSSGGTGGMVGSDAYPIRLQAVVDTGSAGVMARAIANGLKPTASGITATLAKDVTTRAIEAAVNRTTSAVEGISVAGGTGGNVGQDQYSVHVKVNVSARQNETATANANAYGPSASRAGAQGAPTRAGGW